MLLVIGVALLALLVIFTCVVTSHAPPSYDLRGKHMVITGGSSGIGQALGKAAALSGCHVTIIARSQSKLETAKEAIDQAVGAVGNDDRPVVSVTSCDVTSADDLERVMSTINTNRSIDVLVTCAGAGCMGFVDELPMEVFTNMMSLNYFGTVNAVKACVPLMKRNTAKRRNPQQQHRIVLVSSMAGQVGITGMTAYSPSKFAVRGLGEALHMELKPDNIAVSVCFPPDTNTPGLANEALTKPEECKLVSEGGGLLQPDDVAADIMRSFHSWSFTINSATIDGWMLGSLTAGMTAPSGCFWLIVDTLVLPLLRFVAIGYLWSWDGIIAASRGRTQHSSLKKE